jgi:hypothetical protein
LEALAQARLSVDYTSVGAPRRFRAAQGGKSSLHFAEPYVSGGVVGGITIIIIIIYNTKV